MSSAKKLQLKLFNEGKKKASAKRFAVGLDFGTTHSGTAFAQVPAESENVDISQVEIVAEPNTRHTFKEPTSVLLNKQDGSLIAYGYEARDSFVKMMTDLSEMNETAMSDKDPATSVSNMLFFDGKAIKMRLENPEASMCISYDGTHRRPLADIIILIISHLKTKAIKDIKTRAGVTMKPTDCTWILTVPAIWPEKNKSFMRRCAHKAGLIATVDSEDLIMASEPECASICANTFLLNSRGSQFVNGSRVLTVDCGGGTVDVVSMKVSKSSSGDFSFGKARNTGGPWGATCVDDAFKKFVEELVGRGNFEFVQNNAPQALLELMDEWERAKKKFSENFEDPSFEVKIPINEFLAHVNDDDIDVKALVSKYNERCADSDHKIRTIGRNKSPPIALKSPLLRSFFDSSITEIVNCVKQQLAKKKHSHLVLAGGYAESRLLREEIKKGLSGQDTEILLPPKAGAAIMIGAAQFGLQPSVITSRYAALTFGVAFNEPWSTVPHSKQSDARYKSNKVRHRQTGDLICVNRFKIFVKAGEEVRADEVHRHVFKPLSREQTEVGLSIYASKKKDVEFIDEKGCVPLGRVQVSIDTENYRVNNALPDLQCELSFGTSEIRAVVRNLRDGTDASITLSYEDARHGISESPGHYSEWGQIGSV